MSAYWGFIRRSKWKNHSKEGYELAFLEVLDRRRYRLELIEGQAENFKASSRSKL
jgi:hypothetical protein